MKKNIFLFVTILLLLISTGCGKKENGGGTISGTKTMTCTKEAVDDNGYKTSEEVKVTYNSKKVIKVKQTTLSEMDSQIIDFAVSAGQQVAETFNKLDGIKLDFTMENTNTTKTVMELEFDKINPDQIKEVLGSLYNDEDDNFFDKKDVTIEEFKKESLKDYTCTE